MSLHLLLGILENSIEIDFPIKLLNWGNIPFCFKNHSLMLKVLYFMIKKKFSQSRGVAPTKVLATIMFDLPHDTGP